MCTNKKLIGDNRSLDRWTIRYKQKRNRNQGESKAHVDEMICFDRYADGLELMTGEILSYDYLFDTVQKSCFICIRIFWRSKRKKVLAKK